ncbi:MAG: phosphoenolpyruvate carboxylase, partial [Bacteroidota bacterium]
MFKVIQYIERQVVLFDSVEDANLTELTRVEQSMGISDFLQLATNAGAQDQVLDKLREFSARLVFTAHPTQFYPPHVLDIIADLRSTIARGDVIAINDLLRQLGLTSLLNSDKPTPVDEAKNIIYYLRHVYYDSIGAFFKAVKELVGGEAFDNYGIIKLGFWPGGDRDGNPFVTHETTLQVADELRMTLMKCYYNDVKQLQRKLTFKQARKPMAELRKLLYDAMFNPQLSLTAKQILDPLEYARALILNDYHGIYAQEVDDLIDKVNIFRTHFATIDVRQDHAPHRHAVQEILKKHGVIKQALDELEREELKRILLEDQLKVDLSAYDDPVVVETIKTIRVIPEIQQKNGEDGCQRYVISNSEDIYAVLFVYALLRWGHETDSPNVDIVPLFETMKGMDASAQVMQELLEAKTYKDHVTRRSGTQTMMLGFSDGTKDGGYIKANWAIHQTKERLTEVCARNGFRAIFFDGRGGPPARGGGKSHRFYASQGNTIANNEIQLTIQGQTISSIYGTPEQFKFNSAQLITAGLSTELYGAASAIGAASRTLISELAAISFEKYTQLKAHPKFLDYLEHKSTLKYYGLAKIGSRPGKRGKTKQLALSDLRAISFVGSWNQLKQNIPGFFGIGTALNALKAAGSLGELQALFHEVKWFKALMLNAMMALSKSNFNLTSYMQNDPEYGAFWQILHDEYVLSVQMLLEISGYTELMQEEIISKRSIEMREQMILPLLVIQQYAL